MGTRKKGRRLDLLEKQILEKCYEGKRYEDIEQELRYASGTLKKNNAPALLKLLSEVIGEAIHKKTLVIGLENALQQRLQTIDTHHAHPLPFPIFTDEQPQATDHSLLFNLSEVPDVSDFCGRIEEQEQLKYKIITERCRLVIIQGMVGIGKTYLAAKLAREMQGEFQYVIWKALRSRPSFNEILKELIQHFSPSNDTEISLSQLIKYLQTYRCLIILDDLEMVLEEGYQKYHELLEKIATVSHQSCLLLNSRELPQIIDLLPNDSVYSLLLKGDVQIAKRFFRTKIYLILKIG